MKKKRGGIWVAGQSRLRRGKPGGGHAESHMEFVRVSKFQDSRTVDVRMPNEAHSNFEI